MREAPRGGRSWFVVESKLFEILVEDVGRKLRWCIWERCRGVSFWIRFRDFVVCWMELRPVVGSVIIEDGSLTGRRGVGSIGWSIVQAGRDGFFFALFMILR